MHRLLITVTLVLAAVLLAPACASLTVQESPPKPNIVLILTDDMRLDELEHMPKTQSLLVGEGVEYSNAFVTTSQCCPSRASILRGQYVHNHGVWSNAPPAGGYKTFESQGHEASTIATWLHDAGYRTVLLGKYMNGYPRKGQETYVPPGWDEWYTRFDGDYYDYKLNENGTDVVSYGSTEQDYWTDVLSNKAQDFLSRSAGDSQPFFMYLAPNAPHDPFVSAPRHDGMFEDMEAPRSPSFDESDVSDKPLWVNDRSSLSADEEEQIDQVFRERLEMLQAVDDMVEGVVSELTAQGELDDTYIFFTSDNGYHLGEHRILEEKNTPYEESIKAPLAVRGPGIPPGRVTDQIALNIDLAPTFAELGEATTPSFADGRSLTPTFASEAPSWRTAFLEEFWNPQRGGKQKVRSFTAIRTATYKYIDNEGREDEELYDLTSDPYELDNLYNGAAPDLLEDLKARLEAMESCSGKSCQTAENRP